MNREELSRMVELLRDTAKLHQPSEEILTDVKAESFVFAMDSVLAELQKNESAEEWYKLILAKWDSAEGEYIKKEDAIKAFEPYRGYLSRSNDTKFVEDLKNLPTVSFPDREKGEWIKIQSGDDKFPESIVCSKCKNENSHLDFDEHGEPIGKVFITSKFCPNCGADMRKPYKAESEE